MTMKLALAAVTFAALFDMAVHVVLPDYRSTPHVEKVKTQ